MSETPQRTSKLNIDSLKNNVNDVVLDFHEKVPRQFWRVAIVMQVLPSRDSEKIREAIVRIAKTNTILKHPVNKLFTVENTYDTKQTDKASHKEIALPFPCCPVNHEYS